MLAINISILSGAFYCLHNKKSAICWYLFGERKRLCLFFEEQKMTLTGRGGGGGSRQGSVSIRDEAMSTTAETRPLVKQQSSQQSSFDKEQRNGHCVYPPYYKNVRFLVVILKLKAS